ncbi:winged helix-turn-helix transcriptional regulator [Shinella sp. PSBB067]|uniref:MarR family winged helix-turn-helix transcriptional regulator n=1 Tax=Shinella sp. PSBB067 TaxID=2715959 RepID=UPI00193AED1E|nr:MarR family winged helix-turn-helix transcriptional regulator [Shinella sp. PSBB067]QRI62386.1 winged helix-turn-helix transcriptional regulator [Shinella sp. PSBB067]
MRRYEFDDDLYDAPGHLIRRLQQAAVSMFMTETASAGLDLTPVQFGALTMTKHHPGIDQVTLAGLIAYDKATIGEVVSRLIAKGLLTRIVSSADRRSRELYVTDAGSRQLTKMTPGVWRVQQQLLAALSESEQVQFLDLLKKVTESVNERSRAPLRTADS